MSTARRIRGVLHLQLVTNGTVSFVFMPGNVGAGSGPLLSKNIEVAQADLVRTCVRSGTSVSSAVIRGIKTEEWAKSDWPEAMEVARQVFYASSVDRFSRR